MQKLFFFLCFLAFCPGLRAQFFQPNHWVVARAQVSLDDRGERTDYLGYPLSYYQQIRHTSGQLELWRINQRRNGWGLSLAYERKRFKTFNPDTLINRYKEYDISFELLHRSYLTSLGDNTRAALFLDVGLAGRPYTADPFFSYEDTKVWHWYMPLNLGADFKLCDGVWLELKAGSRFFNLKKTKGWFSSKEQDFSTAMTFSSGIVFMAPVSSLQASASATFPPLPKSLLLGGSARAKPSFKQYDLDVRLGKFLNEHWAAGGLFNLRRIDYQYLVAPGLFLRHYRPLSPRLAAFSTASASYGIGKSQGSLPGKPKDYRYLLEAGLGGHYRVLPSLALEASCSIGTSRYHQQYYGNDEQLDTFTSRLAWQIGVAHFIAPR